MHAGFCFASFVSRVDIEASACKAGVFFGAARASDIADIYMMGR